MAIDYTDNNSEELTPKNSVPDGEKINKYFSSDDLEKYLNISKINNKIYR